MFANEVSITFELAARFVTGVARSAGQMWVHMGSLRSILSRIFSMGHILPISAPTAAKRLLSPRITSYLYKRLKVSSRLTLNFGLRYELDPPLTNPGTHRRSDPALYRSNMEVDSDGLPMGPLAAGIVEAARAFPVQLRPVTCGKRVVKSLI